MEVLKLAKKIQQAREDIKKIIDELSRQKLDVEIMRLTSLSKFNFVEVLKKWGELDRELLNCQDILAVK